MVRRLGSRLMGVKGGRLAKGRFGGGSSSSRVTPGYLMELLRGMSEEEQATSQGELWFVWRGRCVFS